MFSDSESDSGDEQVQLSINEHYAKAFQYRKEREELEKLKAKYGSDAEEDDESETDSESAESEDEDGEELTPAVDAAILRTLARIKRKDPQIYKSEKDIFQEEHSKSSSLKWVPKTSKDSKDKPVTLKQVILQSALDAGTGSRSPSPVPLTHVQEQQMLRDETIAAFHTAVDANDVEEDDLLVPREKTKDELEREEEEYKAFLEREVGDDLAGLITLDDAEPFSVAKDEPEEDALPATDAPRKKNKRESKKSKEDENQEFLMKSYCTFPFYRTIPDENVYSYILNRGWIDRSAKRVPTYREITSKTDKGKGKERAGPNGHVSDSENQEEDDQESLQDKIDHEDEFDDVVDAFESSYNFRYEEPDAAVIKTYPRDIASTVRRESTTRKEARERRKERKEEEMQKKREEVRRLKALKMKEIRAKLDKIGRESGKRLEDDPALQELDLEGDWDPEAHDRQMANLYGDGEDFVDEEDVEKPHWDEDIDIGDIVMPEELEEDKAPSKKDKKKKKRKKEKGGEDETDGVDVDAMDADVERDPGEEEEWDGTEEMRKRKLSEYLDELYGMDFNDMVGGMPTRFKYVPVQSQSYALTAAEILMADDKELNEYMGVKKYAPYRKDARWDPQRSERLQAFKQKIATRMNADGTWGTASANGWKARDEEKPAKKRKGKKERMRQKADSGDAGEADGGATKVTAVTELPVNAGSKRKRPAEDVPAEDPGEYAFCSADADANAKTERTGKKKRRRHRKKEGKEE
ncbi:hypothetical protein FISHEDRAFT_70028 [Fistulina hepatica ATCC 64428]|uniref:Kri1-like C-terminal domain-containing protein n=1 Tax=Fistulina hepatica ATCC 64428 TaxID=1128425 RepID=A0A0D7ANI9_9AGAR|nr:hypothetical protein FISHEDRAFT_70028 [Fistulina hepatica ATCC 64428]